MKKTQIAEAIEYVQELHDNIHCAPDSDFALGEKNACRMILKNLRSKLPAEREDIKEAYKDGAEDLDNRRLMIASEYFDKTFKQ
jgi:hypothetical protein